MCVSELSCFLRPAALPTRAFVIAVFSQRAGNNRPPSLGFAPLDTSSLFLAKKISQLPAQSPKAPCSTTGHLVSENVLGQRTYPPGCRRRRIVSLLYYWASPEDTGVCPLPAQENQMRQEHPLLQLHQGKSKSHACANPDLPFSRKHPSYSYLAQVSPHSNRPLPRPPASKRIGGLPSPLAPWQPKRERV